MESGDIMAIKIAFFDIDGTLASNKKSSIDTMERIPASALKTLKRLKQNGIIPVIATGRGRVGILDFVADLGLDSFVAANGQSVVFKNKEIYKYYLDKQLVVDCLKQLITLEDVTVGIETTIGRVLCKGDGTRLPFKASIVDTIEDSVNYDVYQLSLYGENLKEKVFLQNVGDLKPRVVGPTAMNILSKHQSKKSGIEKMLSLLNLSKEEAIAFGDEENDFGMFEAVGISVAMGNAIDSLKRKATYVTDDVDQDGIYNACKYFNLI